MSGPTLTETMRERLLTFRRARGWTQGELAASVSGLGVPLHPTAITRIERGTRKVTVEELAALAWALDVSPTLLVLPLGTTAEVQAVPGHSVPTWDAAKWWMGDAARPRPVAE